MTRVTLTAAEVHRVEPARKLLLDHAATAKRTVIDHLETGNRDWVELGHRVRRYVAAQAAADILGGYEFDGDAVEAKA